ncbi:MAG: zinc ribbon domain-containing protein [Nitrospirota bacterium]|jgi:putative FmdB family regulatory protein
MPIYEYICKGCGEGFLLLQRVGANEKDTICSKCGSQEVKKKFSAFSHSLNTGFSLPSHTTGGHR